MLPMRWDDATRVACRKPWLSMMHAEMVMYQKDTSQAPRRLEYMNANYPGGSKLNPGLCKYLDRERRMV